MQVPGGAYIWRGDLTEGFLRYRFEDLIFGGAYAWRGLFSEFYGIERCARSGPKKLTKTYNKGFPNHSTLINYV